MPEWRNVTRANGAGGANRAPSYAGIVNLLDNLFLEVPCLLRMHEPRAAHVSHGRNVYPRYHNVHGCFLRQAHIVGQSDLTVFDNS